MGVGLNLVLYGVNCCQAHRYFEQHASKGGDGVFLAVLVGENRYLSDALNNHRLGRDVASSGHAEHHLQRILYLQHSNLALW